MKSLVAFSVLIFSSFSAFAAPAKKPLDLNGKWAGRGNYFDSLAPKPEQCKIRFQFKQEPGYFHFLSGSDDCGPGKQRTHTPLELRIGGTVVYLNGVAIGTLDDKRLHLILTEGDQQTELNLVMNNHFVMYSERRAFVGSPHAQSWLTDQ